MQVMLIGIWDLDSASGHCGAYMDRVERWAGGRTA